ncbi:permease prefix domain 1-containing protein [Paenibacillus lautus]|uniref:permease prefix domain 1-containing protein n=1 Tax=Paenibacillus lautus TaxID=1401 RepID=UPI00203ADCCE|nr:permease prefix domain 1-containing protein [Paenibacillus lautus]MCM3259707.1 permease prefix domain 1-containing protein [Paenibacillus lautus]
MTNRQDLEIFVDRLFANQRKTKEVVDLKNEVLSNLEARVTDYMENGIAYQSAISLAIENMEDIESLIDDTRKFTATVSVMTSFRAPLFIPCWPGSLPFRPGFCQTDMGEHAPLVFGCINRCGVSFHVTASETV